MNINIPDTYLMNSLIVLKTSPYPYHPQKSSFYHSPCMSNDNKHRDIVSLTVLPCNNNKINYLICQMLRFDPNYTMLRFDPNYTIIPIICAIINLKNREFLPS